MERSKLIRMSRERAVCQDEMEGVSCKRRARTWQGQHQSDFIGACCATCGASCAGGNARRGKSDYGGDGINCLQIMGLLRSSVDAGQQSEDNGIEIHIWDVRLSIVVSRSSCLSTYRTLSS